MACVALTSLMATIEVEFLQPNHRVCLVDDDEKPLKSLLQKLSYMEAFVKKEYNNAVGGVPIRRHLLNKIRDFALKAEDAIEIQLTNILQLQQKAHLSLQEVEKEAEELLKVINNEVEVAAKDDSFLLIDWSEAAASHPHNIKEYVIPGFRSYYLTLKTNLLLDRLSPERSVLTIVGVPGIGKTTFCKNIYADNKVVSHFDIQAWITIPLTYHGNVQQLLCHLLQSMSPTPLNHMLLGSTVSQLKHQLHNHLKCKRYFIVLDDVPNTLLWDDIQQCFPDDSNGSLILLTTLFRDVAEYISKDCNFINTLPYLDGIQSWTLFSRRFSLKRHMTPKFEEIAMHLVKECSGLPRSIVNVADRLSKCNCTLKEWKKIQKELLSLGTLHRDTQHSSKLASIYNRLPQHLKLCFLYFVVFPKHSQINVKRLIKLWIAEGFVKPLRCLALEDIGYMYLRALRSRGLVNTGYDEYHFRPKTCSIHIDLHSFCVRKAQKEGLLCAANTQQCIGWSLDILANSCRWLSLRSHSLDYHVLFSSNIPRSIFVFQEDFERFISFKHLRILDLSESLILKRVPLLPLRNLVFLRYLSIPQRFESFDDVVSSNSNLQTLIVSGIDESTLGARTLQLPSKIWESQHLRHLKLGYKYMIDPPNMVKEHLQTLVCVMPIHFRKKEVYYCKFPSIRKLKVVYKDILVPGCRNPIIILENFEDLLRLETLMVMVVPVGSITLLERLGFPAKLKKLRLSGTNFPVKVLTVIGQLPKLKVLKLENAFYGRVWEVDEGGFPELYKLEVEARSLERWVANISNPFPRLEFIYLKRCYSLEEIPRVSVISIELEQCHPSVVTLAKRYQEERVVRCIIVDGEIMLVTNQQQVLLC